MAMVSIDNGRNYLDAAEAIPQIMERNLWQALVNVMDDSTREEVAAELAPCSNEQFLARYLELAANDLVIG